MTMERSELEVTVRLHDGATVIDLRGEVDSRADRALDEAYAEATRNGARALVLNFTGATYINSTGIALIVAVLAQARAQAVQVSACGLSDHYREIFEITRLADFMTITDTEDRAVSATERGNDA
jgi:anti-anti-sigma factor